MKDFQCIDQTFEREPTGQGEVLPSDPPVGHDEHWTMRWHRRGRVSRICRGMLVTKVITAVFCLMSVSYARGFQALTTTNLATKKRAFRLCDSLLPNNGTPDNDNNEEDSSSKKNNKKGDEPVNKKRKKQRCADYPSFAFAITQAYVKPYSGKRSKLSFHVRRQDKSTNMKDAILLESDSANRLPPKEVSLKEEKKKLPPQTRTTPFSRVVKGLASNNLSSPFESDILKVARSARQTRLLNDRTYTKKDAFEADRLYEPPSLQDLSPPAPRSEDTVWISTPARVASFLLPYLVFPSLIQFLDKYVTMQPAQLDEIASKFGPGVSILYGTFVSLTLSILYTRQQNIQDNVAIESSLLGVMTRNLLHLFRKEQSTAIEAGQCVADQIRTLVRGSRGQELMLLMYSDPYGRMMELVESREEELLQEEGDLGVHGAAINSCRDVLKDLSKIRANRLSDEALALPPTHFSILTVLTALILFGYCMTVLPTVDATSGMPSNESSLLFGFLCGIYILFYNFTKDMNDPFGGLYQVRRSSTASHLLQIKWLLVNHPLIGGEVDFEPVQDNGNGNEVLIRTPGIGDMWFERDEIYPDGGESES